jgi:hypothetical protein
MKFILENSETVSTRLLHVHCEVHSFSIYDLLMLSCLIFFRYVTEPLVGVKATVYSGYNENSFIKP